MIKLCSPTNVDFEYDIFLMSMKKQMDKSNNEIINMLNQQIGTVFNTLIQNTNKSYELLAKQMGRIDYLFGAPRAQARPTPRISNSRKVETPDNGKAHVNQGQQQGGLWHTESPLHIEDKEYIGQKKPRPIVVNRN